MILSFRCRETELLFNRRPSRRFPPEIHRRAQVKLQLLNEAATLDDLRTPGNHLEPLRGDRDGQWSIRVNIQWRICFVWRLSDAYEVEMVDYH